MSKTCNPKNPLLRDGTSQAQRVLKALLPGYVAVDERKLEDLIAFAKSFAEQIRYWPLDNIDAGDDWVGFFSKTLTEDQKNEPHYALFLAFLKIFEQAQADINTITQRHLDFYYREVLRLKERPAVPDQVFIIFDLVDQVSKSLVAKGTLLDASTDGIGADLRYALDKDIVVNQAKVESLRAVFVNTRPPQPGEATPRPYNQYRLYASPVANSADGKGADLETEDKSWKTFGKPQLLRSIPSPGAAGRDQADIGFAFASPLFFLGEGTRKVTITLSFNEVLSLPDFALSKPQANVSIVDNVVVSTPLFRSMRPAAPGFSLSAMSFVAGPGPGFSASPAVISLVERELQSFFNVSFSGEKEWIVPEAAAGDEITVTPNGELKIVRTIGKGQKPVVAFNEEELRQPFRTSWPVMRLMLNKNNSLNPYFYKQFQQRTITSARIDVEVSDIKGVILQNDEAILKAEQPFFPFGNRPVLGSTFYVGSTEIFQKQLSSLKFDITWHSVPQAAISSGFGAYYHDYIPARTRNNNSFQANVDILDKREWVDMSNITLFNSGNLGQPASISIDPTLLQNVPRDPFMEPVVEFGPPVKRGFMRFTLTGVDFGHQEFQNSFSIAAIKAANGTGSTGNIPNEPYTPSIKDITFSYTSSTVLNLDQSPVQRQKPAFDGRIDQFFHVMPFGVSERHPFLTRLSKPIELLPQFAEEGALFIGLSNIQAPTVLSLLFKVSEGSADPDLSRQPVKWSFMSNNEWIDFTSIQLLADSTNGLLTSGIVTFEIPKAITPDNTAFNSNLFWIRAAVEKDSSAVCDLIDVQAQAVTATFIDNSNDPKHLDAALPAETISALVDGDANIEGVTQPYSSFGGQPVETSTAFYVRVSERLRHKRRAITIKDYELLVLEQFPKIYKAKCLNHTNYTSIDTISERAPGHASMVIISSLRNKNAVDPLKPKTSLITLTEISDYLKSINPPCAELHVRNPIFEEIEMDFNVRFHPGFDSGFFAKQLETDIKQFLAPWAFDSGKDLVFGGRIHKSVVLNFVEERPYVDFVTCFNMHQYIPKTPVKVLRNIDEAVASTSASILTSFPTHKITVLETEDCECPDNEVKTPFLLPPTNENRECGVTPQTEKPKDGVGADIIGNDFIVGHPEQNEGVGFWEVESDFNVQ